MNFSNETIASYKVATLLEEASENTECMLDNTPGILVILNSQNRIIRANKEFCRYLGKSMEDCLHIDFETLFSEEDRQVFRYHVGHLNDEKHEDNTISFKLDMISTHQIHSQETNQGGGLKKIYWQLYRNAKQSQAEHQMITVTGKDLTEVYQSEMKLMNIFSSLPLGMIIVNKEGEIEEVLSQYSEVIFAQDNLAGTKIKRLLVNTTNEENLQVAEGVDRMLACIDKPKSNYLETEAIFPKILSIQTCTLDDDGDPVVKWIKMSHQPIFKDSIVTHIILTLEDITETVYSKREVERVRLLEKQSIALYECAIRDPLSGLYTRLFMKDSVKNLIDSFHRENISELAMVLFDIDNFKSINDQYGHSVGDLVIQEVGAIIKAESRDSDIPVRYGGEEFLVILPSKVTSFSSGTSFAERVRTSVEDTKFSLRDGHVLSITISAGIAYCQKDETLTQLINRADQLLYKAKNSGRNQCVSQQKH